jgi:2-keto-4-pentenoate hydratase/2-oxohepta-3-ene-1,7-dioic acid hydratase in catechol pathway
MASWVRFTHSSGVGFGTLDADTVTIYDGDMFSDPVRTGASVDLSELELLAPCEPTKMIGLWNNFHAAAEKNCWAIPEQPLYFFKPPSCFLAPDRPIERPASYEGRVIYEGELGIVIGRRCVNVAASEAEDHIFGYTCVNDVTALGLLNEDLSFAHWSRAKSFDTFGPFGPVIAAGLDAQGLEVRTFLNGRERQNYPVSDMIFSPQELLTLLSRDMTLEPGDIISCGTSVGALPMKPGATVEVSIDGIGVLRNEFVDAGGG